MSSLAVSGVVFACICLGTLMAAQLPGHQLSDDTKDVVRLGIGVVGTIAALVLGLLIASAKSSFDTRSGQVKLMTADIIVLDELLAQYGPEAKEARQLLRELLGPLAERVWRENRSRSMAATSFEPTAVSVAAFEKIQALSPRNDAQQSLKARAIQQSVDFAQTRLLLYAQSDSAIPTPFLVVLVFWLTIIFASVGLFAHPNPIVVAALLLFALSASAAIFLILELSQPFAGLMAISSEPLRHALAPLRS